MKRFANWGECIHVFHCIDDTTIMLSVYISLKRNNLVLISQNSVVSFDEI